MSIIKVDYGEMSSGGQFKEGEFQSLSNASVTVSDVGFKPDYLLIDSQDTTKSYRCLNMFTSDFPSKKFTSYYQGTDKTAAANFTYEALTNADTIRGTLLSVDDNGFTWGATGGNANYAAAPKFSYKAVKWS